MNEPKKYKLLILESPHKAAVIQKFLVGQNFKCIASKGHILELPKKELGIDLKTFELDLIPIADKKDTIAEIKKLAKEADEIYLGADDDREGGSIAANIEDIIKVGKKPVHRVLFHEITKAAIQKAIANPTVIDERQYEAQKTRRVLDRLVGYKVSPILWDKLGGDAKSAGRVQSIALRLIVDREDDIKSFIPDKFFQIIAKLKKDEIVFESKYFGEKIDNKTDLNATNEDLARKINEEVQKQNFIVKNISTKEKKQNPSAPFTTSRLQQEASTKLKFNAKKTMEIAQKLYEGISLGEKGSEGLITYMRTDSVRTEPKALEDLRTYVEQKFGKAYLPAEAVIYKKKGSGAIQDAHESIEPTSLENSPEAIREFLSQEEFELYRLIWNKFVSSQMNSAVLDQTIVMFDVNNHFFKSVGTVVKFDGFKAVYVDGDDKKDDDEDGALPKLDLEESLNPIDGPKLLEKFTSPPPRYTEATLIKTLEEKGIGRPSTYAAIITNIIDRLYVRKQDNKFHPNDVGDGLAKFLVKHFPNEMEYTFTADMEDKLDQIEDGKLVWTDVLRDFWTGLSASIDKTNKEVASVAKPQGPRKIDPSSVTGIKCGKCESGQMLILKSKAGAEFLGCSAYPECKHTENFKKSKSGEIKVVEKKETFHKDPCSKCESKMVLRKGQYGEYFSCTNYPECKATRPKTTGVACPDCKIGEFVKKKGKNGDFYGCSSFPNCKNLMNFKPVEEACKNCKYGVRGYNERGSKIELICPKCKTLELI